MGIGMGQCWPLPENARIHRIADVVSSSQQTLALAGRTGDAAGLQLLTDEIFSVETGSAPYESARQSTLGGMVYLGLLPAAGLQSPTY